MSLSLKRPVAVVGALTLSVAALSPAFAQSGKANGPGTEWALGAHSSPPKGPGPGKLVAWQVGSGNTRTITFGTPQSTSGNSFYVGYDAERHTLYVPTVAGHTDVINARSFAPQGDFSSPAGSRVARVSPNHGVLLVLSSKRTVAYSLPAHKRLFSLSHGGNAVAFSANGNAAYIGGNMNKSLTEVAIPSGKVMHRYPIGHTGDLVRVDGKLFCADMKSGVMSVLNLRSGRIQRIHTPEVDPHFSYHHIPAATAGFMQLAADPQRHRLYAAGFSGHILEFDTQKPAYLGEIAVKASADKPSKLSGLALVDHGREALTTVENLKTAVLVRLSNGKILRRLPGTISNRWVVVKR